jgi:hypothetical protein
MGGQAKWRKAEIEELKRQSPEEAAVWRQLQNDKRSVAFGINPESLDIGRPLLDLRCKAEGVPTRSIR